MRVQSADRHRLAATVVVAITALAAACVSAGPATATIPTSGTVIEGVGPAAIPIGSTEARMRARWGRLVCQPLAGAVGAGASPERRCFNSLKQALSWVEMEGDGRVAGFAWLEPGWTTTRGVGVGSRIAQVTKAYGRSANVRRTRLWTYIEVVRKVHGETRITGFTGRTKVGDIVTTYVVRRHLRIVQPQLAVVPSGVPIEVALIDFAPANRVELEIQLPWLTRPEIVGDALIGPDFSGHVVIPGNGRVASLLARRPAGTAGPVKARLREAHGGTTPWVVVRLQLPSPPTMVLASSALSGTVPGRVTLNGLEAGGSYSLTAEWTCSVSGALRSGPASVDEIPFLAGGGSLIVPVDSPRFASEIFGSSCVDAATILLPVMLVLSRGSPTGAAERSAMLTTEVTRPT